MNIQEQLMHSTICIKMVENGNVVGLGTGFFVSIPVGKNEYKIALVSNKHVLLNKNDIILTFTTAKNGEPDFGKVIPIPIADIKGSVIGHPNPNVDVAVLICTGLFNQFPNLLYFKAIPFDMLSDFQDSELSVAESIYFIGYPDGRFDQQNNLPLVRTGIIASDPKKDFNGQPQFIIDAQVFPGSSGSPVYINLTYEDMKNGNYVIGKPKIKILGIISATMVKNNRLIPIQTDTSQINFGVQEEIGLGIVFKSTAIKETINLAVKSQQT